MLKIKTIQYPNIPVKTRYLFLKHLQRNVHELALHHQASFLKVGTTAEYFHSDKQNKSKSSNRNQLPTCIHGIQVDGFFTLRAYTEPAIKALDHYQQLIHELQPEWTENCIESHENCMIKKTNQTFVYESKNWLPYRDCLQKNGIFYDKEKNRIADFEMRLKGNIGSFLRLVLGETSEHSALAKKNLRLLQNNHGKKTRIALLIKDQEIKKHPFRVQLALNYQLPQLFSLGQNVAYGNGVFKRIK